MGKGMQMILTVMLATCIMLGSTQLELSAEGQTGVALPDVKLRNTAAVPLAADFNCTVNGAFVINCTSYAICYQTNGRWFVGVETCPAPLQLDPSSYTCSSTYVCPRCTGDKGFLCLSNSTFAFCDKNNSYSKEYTCPGVSLCSGKCSFPCLNDIRNC